jgi:trk system potassium uptake protein TrkH
LARHRLSLHTRLALLISGGLIVMGTAGFAVFESSVKWEGIAVSDGNAAAMHDAGWGGRVLDGLFLSVSSRTAGFNTVDMSTRHLSPPSHMLCALLMFIGGSPASAAGGIKTVSLGVLALGIWSTMRGRPEVEVFGRTIPQDIVRRAAVIVMVMALLVSAVSLLLMLTEPVTMLQAIFETVSACGTVGLSTGITPDLTYPGRLVIMFAMFAGRLGPLTLLLALGGGRDPARYAYPTESVGIG